MGEAIRFSSGVKGLNEIVDMKHPGQFRHLPELD